MYEFRRHFPGWFDTDADRGPFSFSSKESLLALPFMDVVLKDEIWFKEFQLTPNRKELMLITKENKFWVFGYFNEVVPADWFTMFEIKKFG